MARKLRSALIITLVVGMLASLAIAAPLFSGASAPPGAVEAAEKAATAWLADLDAGRYDRTWEEAAPLFKEAVPKAEWAKMAAAARAPLGALEARKIVSAEYATSLPGAPDGEYVVIQTAARFQNKAEATETVTPMKAPDGRWRVSGYYVR